MSTYMLAAAPALVWLIVHCVHIASEGTFATGWEGLIPRFMVYSSFTTSEASIYVAMIVVLMVLHSTTLIAKWLTEDRLR